jgi:mannose-6-phosphate isomerase-like protein (cupin superfamily)
VCAFSFTQKLGPCNGQLNFLVRRGKFVTLNTVSINHPEVQHYKWGSVCDGWHLLKDASLSVIQERVPAGAGEQRHYHSVAQQFFYILSGRALIELDGRSVTLGAGEGLHVPAKICHCFKNVSGAEVTFLVISNPSTAEDRTNVF